MSALLTLVTLVWCFSCTSAPPTLQECLDQSPAWRAMSIEQGGVTPEFIEQVNEEIRKCEVRE